MIISYMIRWCARFVAIIDFVASITLSMFAGAVILLAVSCTVMTTYVPENKVNATIVNTTTTVIIEEDKSLSVKNVSSELCSAFFLHVPISPHPPAQLLSIHTVIMWMLALLMAFLLVEPLYANTELLRATFSVKMNVEVREAIRLMRFWSIPYVVYTVFGLMLLLYYHAHWIHPFSWLSFRAFCLLVVRTYMEELKLHPNHDNVIYINSAAWEGTSV